MTKSRKKGEQAEHIHVDKHANKRPTHKDAWRNNSKTGEVDVESLREYLRSYDRPTAKKANRR